MKITSKLFLESFLLVQNIPFTAEIPFLRSRVVRFLDESASFASGSSFAGLVKMWLTTGSWFCSEVIVPDTWSAARLMNGPVNGPVALKVFVKQTETRCKGTLLAAAGRVLLLIYQPCSLTSRSPGQTQPSGSDFEVSCDQVSSCRQLLSRGLLLALGVGSGNSNVTNMKTDFPATKMQQSGRVHVGSQLLMCFPYECWVPAPFSLRFKGLIL